MIRQSSSNDPHKILVPIVHNIGFERETNSPVIPWSLDAFFEG